MYPFLFLCLLIQTLGSPFESFAQTLKRGPYLQQGTSNSMIIKWRVPSDQSDFNTVYYGTSQNSLLSSAVSVSPTNLSLDGTALTEMETTLSGLAENSVYHYAIGNAAGPLPKTSARGSFITAPANGTSQATRIWVLGNSGIENNNSENVKNGFRTYSQLRSPNLLLMLGDNGMTEGTDSEYQVAVFDQYGNYLRDAPLWPTLGDAEGNSSDASAQTGAYFNIFNLPKNAEAGGVASGTESYYSYNYANIHFVVLNSAGADRSPGSPMLTWLNSDLAVNSQEWTIAYWHHPPYSKGDHDSDTEIESKEMRENVLPILEKYGVDLVLSGRSHSYERSAFLKNHNGDSGTFNEITHQINGGNGRSLPEEGADGSYSKSFVDGQKESNSGTVYSVVGSSSLLEEGSLNHPAMVVSLKKLGSMVLDITGNRLEAIFLDSMAQVEDKFSIVHTPDAQAPQIFGAQSLNTSTVNIQFSEPVEKDSAEDISNYSLNNEATLVSATRLDDPRVVQLVTSELDPNVIHILNVVNVKDETAQVGIAAPGIKIKFVPNISTSMQQGVLPDENYSGAQDAYVNSSDPETNYGETTSLSAWNSVDETGDASRSLALLQWDLSSVPEDSVVQFANLSVNVTEASSGQSFLYEAKTSWKEGTVNWNTFADPATKGDTILGTLEPGEAGSHTIHLNQAGRQLVQDWIDGNIANNGFILQGDATEDLLSFDSSEVATPEDRPRLQVLVTTAQGDEISKELGLDQTIDHEEGDGSGGGTDGEAVAAMKEFTVLSKSGKKIVYDEAELEIEKTSLENDTNISITPLKQDDLPKLDPGMVNVTKGPRKGYRFLPHGQRFKNKIKVKLPYDLAKIPAGKTAADIRTYFFDDEAGQWKKLERVQVDANSQKVISNTNHFTDMINAVVTVPDSPQTASFNPTQLKDIKAADPGAKINLIEAPQANNMGDARVSYPIEIPPGRNGMHPQLAVQYNSSGGNGWMGVGWDLPMQTVSIDTRWGVPRYSSTEETETYLLNGEQLTPVAHRDTLQPRTADKIFHTRIEGQFRKIIRHGDLPDNYWWEVIDKNGTRFFYGGGPDTNGGSGGPTTNSTLVDASGNIGKWSLREVRDTNGNFTKYTCVRESDSGLGDGTGGVQGSQLYLQTITYSGHGATEGLYKVEFTRESELTNPVRRPDAMIDARLGFKMVTADLLRIIEVSFNNQPVRSYRFDYIEGAFRKTLLEKVSQFDENANPFDTAAIPFNFHNFEYFDEAREANDIYRGFARPSYGQVEFWNTGNDNVKADGLLGDLDASAISGNEGSGFGGHLYIGIGTDPTKYNTVGGKVGFNSSETEGLLALIDINGDSLPDKVFREGNTVYYRANQSGPFGGTVFGDKKVVANLSDILVERNNMFSFGVESYWVGFLGFNLSNTFVESPIYFTDVNGDSLPDLVRNGGVLFNQFMGVGDPVFTPNSSDTVYPIGPGVVNTNNLLESFQALFEQQIDNFPLIDTLRKWVAPFDGQIQITGNVALIEDTSPERADYTTADGVRVAIQHNASELWTATIVENDYTAKTPTGVGAINVVKGDIIYFRVQSEFDGAYDQVNWDPTIQYLGVVSTLDPNNLDAYVYQASADFVLHDSRGGEMGMPLNGMVQVEGTLEKNGVTSDDITVELLKNGSVIFTQTLNWDVPGSAVINQSVSVIKNEFDNTGTQTQVGDTLSIRVLVDSPIDLTQINWLSTNPIRAYYTSSPDIPNVNDQNGNPLVNINLFPDTDLYPENDLTAPLVPWVAPLPMTQTYTVTPALAAGGGSSVQDVVVTVKRNGDRVAKHLYSDGPFTIDATQNDELFFEFTTRDPDLFGNLTQMAITVTYDQGGVPQMVQVPTAFNYPEQPTILTQRYRGWTAFGYNGNRDRATQPINITQEDLTLSNLASLDIDALNQALQDAVNNQNPDLSLGDDFKMNLVPFFPAFANQRWEGNDPNLWADGTTLSSSRNGPDYISVPTADSFAGASAVPRLSQTNQIGFALGVGFVSGSLGTSVSRSILDFKDLNGDQFPDVIGSGLTVQFSPMIGGLEGSRNGVGLSGDNQETEGESFVFGISGGFPSQSGNSTANVDSRAGAGGNSGNTTLQLPALGISISGSVSQGESEIQYDLRDINGDGLPDKIILGGTISVQFNLGYTFSAPESWDVAKINFGESDGTTLGLGYNDGVYGWGAGVSGSESESISFDSLQDINGDGLLDRVSVDSKDASVIHVGFNTGNSFTINYQLESGLAKGMANTISETEGGGVYFTYPYLLFPLPPIFLVINPGVDFSATMGRVETSIIDVDGDGYPDHLFTDQDHEMQVARNLHNRTNILKHISRPLGGTVDIEYVRSGNTYDQPQSRWVMSRVKVFDGFVGDGVDTQVMTYEYEDGFFHRQEREFYGYRTVIENDCDSTNDPDVTCDSNNSGGNLYRTVTRKFINDLYYSKGLMEEEVIADASGNLFIETINEYLLRDINTGNALVVTNDPNDVNQLTATVFPELSRVDKFFYEGQATAQKTTHMTYQYDTLGNVIRFFDAGDTGAQDDVEAIIGYFSDLPNYIVGKADSILVNGNTVEFRRREADIQPGTGNLLQVRQYLANGTPAVTDLTYDAFGNIASVTGPLNLNGQRYQIDYLYDSTVNTYVTSITDSFGYNSTATYNLLYGLVENTTDINANAIDRTYDAVGRVDSITGPFQTGTGNTTINFEYHPKVTDTDPLSWALTQHIDVFRNVNDPIETVLFTDGLKRVLQTKKDLALHVAEGSPTQDVMTVSGRVIFDFVGRTINQYYPVTESLGNQGAFNVNFDTVQPTVMTYDILDRNLQTTIPDNTSTVMAYDFGNDRSGTPQFRTTVTDANGIIKQTFRDVRNLITSVKEFNNAGSQILWTSYAYDPLKQITQVVDDLNNTTNVEYDNFGRRTVINNPDTGRTETQYDLASNVTARITANLQAVSQQISYNYDFNRLSTITYPQFTENNVAYTYGAPGAPDNRANRIVTVSDESGSDERFYDVLGNVVKSIRSIDSDTQGTGGPPEVYTTEFVYDTWNRLHELTYPDTEVLTYHYDSGGLVHDASGVKGAFPYAYFNKLEYDKFEQRKFVEYGNGVKTTYAYDPLDRRLFTLKSVKPDTSFFQDLLYTYDDVGNILQLKNLAAVNHPNQIGGATTQNYQYDDLYRLTHADGEWTPGTGKKQLYDLDMGYNTIHNIQFKDQMHTELKSSGQPVVQQKTTYNFVYGYTGPHPHAPTAIGDRTFTYDANGNQTAWTHNSNGTQRTITWDEENRIQGISDNGDLSTYKYDDTGQRVIKSTSQGETVYVNRWVTARNRDVGTKHVFAGQTRVVSKLAKQERNGQIIEEKDLFYYHPDHLGSNGYVTDEAGAIYQHHEFFPFGETWIEETGNTQPSPYLFTGKELDEETKLYYYGARYFDPRTSVWQSPDPILGELIAFKSRHESLPRKLSLYSYGLQNPLVFTDPDGRDALIVVFTQYKVEVPGLGKIGGLGHAGVVLIDNKSGFTKYYEYGRYDRANRGVVRNIKVPNVQMDENGKPTSASMKKLLRTLSKKAGHNSKIEGAYIKNDNFKQMFDYAKGRKEQNNDPDREPYDNTSNNCLTFCLDTSKAGGAEVPDDLVDWPNQDIGDIQDDHPSVRFDPENDEIGGMLYDKPSGIGENIEHQYNQFKKWLDE